MKTFYIIYDVMIVVFSFIIANQYSDTDYQRLGFFLAAIFIGSSLRLVFSKEKPTLKSLATTYIGGFGLAIVVFLLFKGKSWANDDKMTLILMGAAAIGEVVMQIFFLKIDKAINYLFEMFIKALGTKIEKWGGVSENNVNDNIDYGFDNNKFNKEDKSDYEDSME